MMMIKQNNNHHIDDVRVYDDCDCCSYDTAISSHSGSIDDVYDADAAAAAARDDAAAAAYKEMTAKLRRFTEEEVQNLCTDDEVNKLMEEMQTTIKEVEESEYYRHMVQHFRTNKNIRNNILRVLGGGDHHLQIVMYGVGSPQFSYNSQYQLSLAILLKRDLPHWFEAINIENFDPWITPVDVKVMEALGCKVLNKNEIYPVVEKPTLFFMPQVVAAVFDNLLIANWCPSRLNKMVLFFYNEQTYMSYLAMKTISRHIVKFNCDRDCKTGLPFYKKIFELSSPFCNHSWWFFNLPISDIDANQLEAMLPAETELLETMKRIWNDHIHGKKEYKYMSDMASCLDNFLSDAETIAFEMKNNPFKVKDWSEYLLHERLPSRTAKRNWCPPCTGWIKLNFSAAVVAAAGNEYKVVLGYGGIFHNENKECLLSYSCPLLNKDKEDKEGGAAVVKDLDFAYAEALKEGLRLYMDLQSTSTLIDNRRKLVIEGDSVSIVRWVNSIFPPPKKLVGIIEEIQDLISGIDDEHVLFHIYKEANSMAIDLAKRAIKGIA